MKSSLSKPFEKKLAPFGDFSGKAKAARRFEFKPPGDKM